MLAAAGSSSYDAARLYSGSPRWAGTTVPFAIRHSKMDAGLLHYLQRRLERELEGPTLSARPRGHRVRGHVNRELFMHALQNGGSVFDSRRGIQLQAAPVALRALLEWLRRAVTPRVLTALEAHRDSPFAALLYDAVLRGALFADTDFHVNAGAPVNLRSTIFWHTDPPNSALHLGISLFGRRLLHAECGEGCNVSDTEQVAGSVYLSSPAAFVHGVQYPAHSGGSFAQSIVSVQARMLVNASEGRMLEHARGAMGRGRPPGHGTVRTFEALAGALASGPPLPLPSLQQLWEFERALVRR